MTNLLRNPLWFALCITATSLLSNNVYATYVAADGKEWRQVTDTVNISWNSVSAVCSTTTGVCSGSVGAVDFTGWTWASQVDVLGLFTEFTGSSLDNYEEFNSTWAPAFIDVDGAGSDLGAIGTTIVPTDRGAQVVGMYREDSTNPGDGNSAQLNDWTNLHNGNIDQARTTLDGLSKSGTFSYAGSWLYRETNVIDIKPGSDPNSVNPRSKGVIPVAILGSIDFDSTQVVFTTVTFGPDGASPAHDGHVDDVNDDGFMDAVFHFKTQDTGIVCGDTEATLSGEIFDDTPIPITGTDTINTVGCNSANSQSSTTVEGAGAINWIMLIGLSVVGLWRSNRRRKAN
jgi:hypothetical protein